MTELDFEFEKNQATLKGQYQNNLKQNFSQQFKISPNNIINQNPQYNQNIDQISDDILRRSLNNYQNYQIQSHQSLQTPMNPYFREQKEPYHYQLNQIQESNYRPQVHLIDPSTFMNCQENYFYQQQASQEQSFQNKFNKQSQYQPVQQVFNQQYHQQPQFINQTVPQEQYLNQQQSQFQNCYSSQQPQEQLPYQYNNPFLALQQVYQIPNKNQFQYQEQLMQQQQFYQMPSSNTTQSEQQFYYIPNINYQHQYQNFYQAPIINPIDPQKDSENQQLQDFKQNYFEDQFYNKQSLNTDQGYAYVNISKNMNYQVPYIQNQQQYHNQQNLYNNPPKNNLRSKSFTDQNEQNQILQQIHIPQQSYIPSQYSGLQSNYPQQNFNPYIQSNQQKAQISQISQDYQNIQLSQIPQVLQSPYIQQVSQQSQIPQTQAISQIPQRTFISQIPQFKQQVSVDFSGQQLKKSYSNISQENRVGKLITMSQSTQQEQKVPQLLERQRLTNQYFEPQIFQSNINSIYQYSHE